MFQVRIHGRRGLATASIARILAEAAAIEGWHSWAGAIAEPARQADPVVAYVALHDRPVDMAGAPDAPDAVLVQDETLLYDTDVLAALRPHGLALLNAETGWQRLRVGERLPAHRALIVPATRLAWAQPWPGGANAALLGGFAAASGVVSVGALGAAIARHTVSRVATEHVVAAWLGHDYVADELRRLSVPDRVS
jgi:pyruvate ferredoxin oxidoreductase gamma subunit